MQIKPGIKYQPVSAPSNFKFTARRFGILDLDKGKSCISTPKRPDRLWGPRILLFNEYQC